MGETYRRPLGLEIILEKESGTNFGQILWKLDVTSSRVCINVNRFLDKDPSQLDEILSHESDQIRELVGQYKSGRYRYKLFPERECHDQNNKYVAFFEMDRQFIEAVYSRVLSPIEHTRKFTLPWGIFHNIRNVYILIDLCLKGSYLEWRKMISDDSVGTDFEIANREHRIRFIEEGILDYIPRIKRRRQKGSHQFFRDNKLAGLMTLLRQVAPHVKIDSPIGLLQIYDRYYQANYNDAGLFDRTRRRYVPFWMFRHVSSWQKKDDRVRDYIVFPVATEPLTGDEKIQIAVDDVLRRAYLDWVKGIECSQDDFRDAARETRLRFIKEMAVNFPKQEGRNKGGAMEFFEHYRLRRSFAQIGWSPIRLFETYDAYYKKNYHDNSLLPEIKEMFTGRYHLKKR